MQAPGGSVSGIGAADSKTGTDLPLAGISEISALAPETGASPRRALTVCLSAGDRRVKIEEPITFSIGLPTISVNRVLQKRIRPFPLRVNAPSEMSSISRR